MSGARTPGLRIAGIPLALPWSGLIGVGVLTWLFAPGFSDGENSVRAYVVAAVFAVLVYASILVHELAHAGAASHFGLTVHEIRIYALGGYTAYDRKDPAPGRELLIALAGPASTLALAAACGAGARISTATLGPGSLTTELLMRLAAVGVLLGIYNLLPGLPLDGGAVVKSTVWKVTGSETSGTRVAAWCGLVVAVAVFAVPFYFAARRGSLPDITTVAALALFAGWLGSGAWSALQRAKVDDRVDDLNAAALARPAVIVSRDLPLSLAVEQRDAARATAIVVVDSEGRPIAVAHDAAANAVPPERRPWVTVASVSRSIAAGALLNESLTGHELLGALAATPSPEYLVIDAEGRLVGVLSLADVQGSLGAA